MNFKDWLLNEEQLFNEDFKTQREKFIQQGIEPNIVDSYLANFRTIKDKKYKQINDPIHGLENIKDRTNIDNYKTFHELEILVDYVKGQVDVVGKTNYKNIKIDAKPIYEDNNIIIYYADSPQACITYKGNVPYSWCVARSDASNMFYTYRFKEHRPAFYFVKNKERTNNEFKFLNLLRNVATLTFKDPYHFFVIQVVKNANPQDKERKQYIVTSAQNNSDVEMSWNDIVKIEPALANLQNKFVSNPLSEKEEELYNRFKKGISDAEFTKLPYDEKDMYLNIYVRIDKPLTDNQFKNLPFDLKNKYIGFGVGLSDEQMKMIDSKLYKRYEEVTKTKIEKTIGTGDFKLKSSEIEIFIKFANEFNLEKLSDRNVRNFLDNATDKEQIAQILGSENISKLSDDNVRELLSEVEDRKKIEKIIIQYKKELSDSNIYYLLYHATDIEQIAQMLGSNNISKLSDYNVRELLLYAKDKEQMTKIIIQYKKELSDENVFYLLRFAEDKDQMAKILGPDNINKLSDDHVKRSLRYATPTNHLPQEKERYAKDKEQMTKIIIQYKKELSDDNIHNLLRFAEDENQMAEIIIKYKKEFSYYEIGSLLYYATDKEQMAKIIIQYKKELSNDNVYYLLRFAEDENQMAKILGSDNINKLSDKSVYYLLLYAEDKEQIAQILGSDNISKLSDDNVYDLLDDATDKKQMAQIIDKYHQKKTPKIQELIDKYLL